MASIADRSRLIPMAGALSGEVRAQYNDGRSFEGTLRNSRKEGFGTYAWPDGQRYQGQWRDDLQDGKGTLTFANGDVYGVTSSAMNAPAPAP